MLSWIQKHYILLVCGILLFSFLTRVYSLTNPKIYIFDEVYHAVTAKLMARNDPQAFEWWNEPVEPNTAVDWLHPPLAKYFQAFFILLFGENTLGWRFSSVVFGVLVILAVTTLTNEAFRNQPLALLAGLLASLDGLLLVQSRIAMNDIHVTFFILLTLIQYIRHLRARNVKTVHIHTKHLWLTGLCAGLAISSKWSGVYILLPIFLFEFFLFFSYSVHKKNIPKLSYLAHRFLALILIPAIIYIASYSLMFVQGKSLICDQNQSIQGQCYFETFKFNDTVIWEGYVSHFIELHRQIWWYQTNLEATHSYQSRPLEWFLNLKPVWYHVEYENKLRADIYAQGNTSLFWIGDVIVIGLGLYLFLKAVEIIKKKNYAQNWLKSEYTYLALIFVTYLSVWVPWQFSPRIMFFYHYTPAVPFLCILTAYGIYQLLLDKNTYIKNLALILISLIAITFFVFYPHWTGIPVSTTIKDNLYFGIKSWK